MVLHLILVLVQKEHSCLETLSSSVFPVYQATSQWQIQLGELQPTHTDGWSQTEPWQNYMANSAAALSFAFSSFHFLVCARSARIEPAVTVGNNTTTQYLRTNRPIGDSLPTAIKLETKVNIQTYFLNEPQGKLQWSVDITKIEIKKDCSYGRTEKRSPGTVKEHKSVLVQK